MIECIQFLVMVAAIIATLGVSFIFVAWLGIRILRRKDES